MHPYRVFICYAHEDKWLAERVEEALRQLGLEPWYDPHITPGTPFTDAIKSMITHAHLFVPLITENSQMRPWVHQETGYAIALNIPVLPIALETVPGEMIAQLQALVIPESATVDTIIKLLAEVNIARLVKPMPAPPRSIVEIAEWMEDRTRMLAEYCDRVMELAGPQRLRQRGGLSSFCLPDADISDPVWDRREGLIRRSQFLRLLQRQERKALEAHVRKKGCALIIDPSIEFVENGLAARRTRLQTLRDALSGLTWAGVSVEVVTSPLAREGNVTILGDWFVAESLVPRPGGYRQTVFTWHAPTVLEWINKFDEQFGYLCARAKAGERGIVGPEPEKVIEVLDGIISSLPEEDVSVTASKQSSPTSGRRQVRKTRK